MERKQLLGAVFDEIEHHFKLFTLERKVYLALAGVAGLCLLVAAVVLVVRPTPPLALTVLILGGSGLVAFAAARSTTFFHSSISTVEEVVKRYSKVSDPELLSTVAALKKKSEISVVLMAIGAVVVLGSAVFAMTRVWQVDRAIGIASEEAARRDVEIARWKESFNGAQQAYATLKSNAAALHPVHVTRDHELIEVRATAEQPAAKPRAVAPAYTLGLSLYSTQKGLSSLKRVRYQLPDPFGQALVVEDASQGFKAAYVGNGCVAKIDVTLEMADGSSESFAFDQCRSLAPWAVPPATATTPAAPAAPVPN